MHQRQNAAQIGWTMFLLCLMGMAARHTSAQEQQPERSEKAGTISFDRPFESVDTAGNVASPTAPPDETLPIQRLPPVDLERSKPTEFGFGPGMGMGPGGDRGPISYKTFWFPSVPLNGQPGDWGLVGQDLSLAYPLWVNLPNTVLATASVRNRLISTDAILPDSHQAYPSELWNAQVGMMYMRQLGDDRMIGGGVNLGSASDHPFASINEMNVSMNAMYRMPSGEHNAWMFMLMYAPMG